MNPSKICLLIGAIFTSTLPVPLAGAMDFAASRPERGDGSAGNSSVNRSIPRRSTSMEVESSRRIRQELVKDTDLSSTAQNIKIITDGNTVTLIGTVRSEREKIRVEQIAESAQPYGRVVNELEVKPFEVRLAE